MQVRKHSTCCFFLYCTPIIARRDCNTEYGSLDCWKATAGAFTYGLSTSMIDFCQVILQIHNLTNEKVSCTLINLFE